MEYKKVDFRKYLWVFINCRISNPIFDSQILHRVLKRGSLTAICSAICEEREEYSEIQELNMTKCDLPKRFLTKVVF